MDWITQPETWIAFLTLVALELVLGVDNVIFISILAGKLPQNQQQSCTQDRYYAGGRHPHFASVIPFVDHWSDRTALCCGWI